MALLKLNLQSGHILLICSFLFSDYPFSHPSLPQSVLGEFQALWVSLLSDFMLGSMGRLLKEMRAEKERLVLGFKLTGLALAAFLDAHKSWGLRLFQRSSWGWALRNCAPSMEDCTGFMLFVVPGYLSLLGALNFTFTFVQSSSMKLNSHKHFEDHLFPAGTLTDTLSLQIYVSFYYVSVSYSLSTN